jgi:hypothetical protein
MILLVKAGAVWSRVRWHSCRNRLVGRNLLPKKANRSRGWDAKPQVRSMENLDSWAAEERAGLAPGGEQALHTSGRLF